MFKALGEIRVPSANPDMKILIKVKKGFASNINVIATSGSFKQEAVTDAHGYVHFKEVPIGPVHISFLWEGKVLQMYNLHCCPKLWVVFANIPLKTLEFKTILVIHDNMLDTPINGIQCEIFDNNQSSTGLIYSSGAHTAGMVDIGLPTIASHNLTTITIRVYTGGLPIDVPFNFNGQNAPIIYLSIQR